jgi:hypothetical protein
VEANAGAAGVMPELKFMVKLRISAMLKSLNEPLNFSGG